MSTTATSNGPASITVRGLRRSYDDVPVLRGMTFEVHAGEIFVIMGPSGSGKSVLLRHLIGLETPDAGEILINGHVAHSEELKDQCRMAMVFQSGGLLNSLTVGENVGLYLVEHELADAAGVARVVAEKLALVGLAGKEDLWPAELSGGMRKRVAIARALVADPQLILFDEPTSELDPVMSAMVGREILELKRRTQVTTLVVTHDRDLAFGIADRIAFVSRGEIRFVGTPSEVRQQRDPELHEFLNVEFQTNTTHEQP
jgi:phospholipid/cholesterol/gamma-HCH transport system ATP-binding protein